MTSREELQDYARQVGLEDLLSDLAQSVLVTRPQNVIAHLIEQLQKRLRAAGLPVPAASSSAFAAAAAPSEPRNTLVAPAPAGGGSVSPLASPATAEATVAARSVAPSSVPSLDNEEPVYLPYSGIDLDSTSETAILGRRYSAACIRRSGISSGSDTMNAADEEVHLPHIEKTDDEKRRLRRALERNFLFNSLDPKQQQIMFDAMFEMYKHAGDVIIKQGEEGDNFYVLDSGCAEIFKETNGEVKKVLQVGPGGSFGELALMYGTPRQATVKAATDVRMWAIDRDTYRAVLLSTTMRKRKLYESFLARVPLLEGLLEYERAIIADVLNETAFNDGEVIIREGEPGDKFYIIVEGNVVCTKNVNGEEQVVAELEASDYFGELALLNNAPRAATVTAKGRCTCVWLDRESFTRVLGSCEEIMKRKKY